MARIVFNKSGFEDLLTSGGVKSLVEQKANEMAGRANAVPSTTDPAAEDDYYEVEDKTTNRARYRVRTTSVRAARHEAKTQALQKSL